MATDSQAASEAPTQPGEDPAAHRGSEPAGGNRLGSLPLLDDRRPPPLRGLLERLAQSDLAQLRLPDLTSRGQKKQKKGTLLLVLVAAAAAALAGWWLLAKPLAVPVENQLPRAAAPASHPTGAGTPARTARTPSTVVVHVAGAVRTAGLQTLTDRPRVADALAAAGGPAPDADLDRLNLAAPVADGERVYVPHKGEQAEPQVTGGSAGSGGPGGGGASPAAASRLDLNRATAEQLDSLPGVGPATAEAILAFRRQHGGFRRVEELQDVRGIGEAKFAQLRGLVTVGPR